MLALIVLLGVGVRFYKLDEKSLWSDEVATIATSLGNSIDPDAYRLRGERFDPPAPVPALVYKSKATQSHGAANFGRTAEVLKANVHPPLFFWLMNLWIHGVGLEPGLLRVPAALFGVLSIFLCFGLSLRLADLDAVQFSANQRQGFALLTSAMLALSAYQVDHAQDARQYTLLLCLALTAVWQVVGLAQSQGRGFLKWVLLALILAAGLYAQYFFLLFAVFVFAVLLWRGRSQKRVWVGSLTCLGLIGLLLLPWASSIFQAQLVFLKLAGHYTSGLWHPVQLPEKLWRIFCEFFMPGSKAGKWLPLLILLGWGSSVWCADQRNRNHRLEKNQSLQKPWALSPVLALCLMWLVCLTGEQILLDLLKNTHTATIRRYLFLVSPACYLLLAYALFAMRRHWRPSRWRWLPVVLGTVLLTVMSVDTFYALFKAHTSSDEFKQAAAYINGQSGPHDLVLVNKTGAMAVGLAYYLKPETRMWGVNVSTAQDLRPGAPLLTQLTRMLPAGPCEGRVWLVFSHSATSTRERLQAWLAQNNYQAGPEFKVPGVRVLQAGCPSSGVEANH
ncbi:hypothetical protein [Vampirovibrio sp.]|uniref:glycosyltransferase family 39 protein n=1 Tax=Vampirovibrio sp. TaxID=2717857 RepID=UPI003594561C